MPTDGDGEYGRRARAVPNMAAPAAAQLVAQAQDGDRRAQLQLITSHRRIVARAAERNARSGLSSDERIRLGEQGLEAAIERFTPAKGFSFSTYATWWVGQAITKGIGGAGGGAGVREPMSPLPSAGSGSIAL
jgi:RNA polymerase primary sigma factor